MLRDWTPSDQDAVRDLVLAGMRERWGDAFDPSFNGSLEDIGANYLGRGGEVVVLDAEGEIVATGTLMPEGDGRGRIVRMSVGRGRRRQGLGRKVVTELIDRARRRGMVEVVVATDTPWTSAVELYRGCGFEEVGRDDTDTHFALRL